LTSMDDHQLENMWDLAEFSKPMRRKNCLKIIDTFSFFRSLLTEDAT
jgi:hypothetical protein